MPCEITIHGKIEAELDVEEGSLILCLARVTMAGPPKNWTLISAQVGDRTWGTQVPAGSEPPETANKGLQIVFDNLAVPRDELLSRVRRINEYIRLHDVS